MSEGTILGLAFIGLVVLIILFAAISVCSDEIVKIINALKGKK